MSIQNRRTRRAGWMAAVLLGLLAGCQEPAAPPPPGSGLPREFLQKHWAPKEVPVAHVYHRDYRIRPGDFLEIIYHVRHRRESEAYRIKIQDVIVVRFPFTPALNQTETVQSDGKLYMDLIGPVDVFDRTIGQVQTDLEEKYAKFIKDVKLTVSFKQSNVNIAELREAIRTAPRGQSRLVPVAPDGRISVPFIVDVLAAGKTIGELHVALNESYLEIGLLELEVTVNLQTIAPTRVYVLGEVNRPGVLLDRTGTTADVNEVTLLQALAHAGSYIPGRADLSKVMLIRRSNLAQPQAAIINVYQLLENRTKASGQPVVADSRKHRYDIWLEDGDIVYVPTTVIAQRADYIDLVWTRGIRAIGGFSSSATYTAADAVDWLGPNP